MNSATYLFSQQVYFHACMDNATMYPIIINAVTLQMPRSDIQIHFHIIDLFSVKGISDHKGVDVLLFPSLH